MFCTAVSWLYVFILHKATGGKESIGPLTCSQCQRGMAQHKNKVLVAQTADTLSCAIPQCHFQTTAGGRRDKLHIILLHLQTPYIRPAVTRMALIYIFQWVTWRTATRNATAASSFSDPKSLKQCCSHHHDLHHLLLFLHLMLVLLFPQRGPSGPNTAIRSSLTLPHNCRWGDPSHTVRFVVS